MHLSEVVNKINEMSSVVEKLDFLYKMLPQIEEKEEAEKLIEELKRELSSERATFLPPVKLSEPKFEFKSNLEEKVSEQSENNNFKALEFKLDVDILFWKDSKVLYQSIKKYNSSIEYKLD